MYQYKSTLVNFRKYYTSLTYNDKVINFLCLGIVRTEYILSITQNFDGSYKMLFILCKEGKHYI